MYSQRDTLRSAPRLKGTNGLLKEALLAFCGLTACNGGTIQGIVLDWQGRPIADARVHIVDPFKAGDSLRNYTKTDEDGSFAIQMDPGKYQVLVSKEQTGYPDLQSSFFSAGDSTPEVSLKGAGNVVSVTVHLRKPCGHLSGHVKDSATGLAVANADLRFEFQHDADTFLEFLSQADGSFDTLVPDHKLVLTVSASKYKPATLSLEPIASGTSREISVSLRMDR